MGEGPVLIGFDGTPASEHAIRESATLLQGRDALVVVVWRRDAGLEGVQVPVGPVGLEPPVLDVSKRVELDEVLWEHAQRMAQWGAQVAETAGFKARSLTAADEYEVSIAQTLIRLARKHDSPAIVVGAHAQGRLSNLLLGSTSHDVVRHADRPVVVVREQSS
jgi:nucleotide-binding universal stress UspA family protein